MKPLILLNCTLGGEEKGKNLTNASVPTNYTDAVRAAGGVPMIFAPPPHSSPPDDLLDEALQRADGVVLIGGKDYDPKHYGEAPLPTHKPISKRRERFDLALARAVLDRGMPVLGICGGIQLMAIAAGGACVPHLGDDEKSPHQDGAGHGVEIEEDSMLARALGGTTFTVNSYHHQAVSPERIGEGMRVSGRAAAPITSKDGQSELAFVPAIEAIESAAGGAAIGVQWHPEKMLEEPAGLPLFKWLVAEAASRM